MASYPLSDLMHQMWPVYGVAIATCSYCWTVGTAAIPVDDATGEAEVDVSRAPDDGGRFVGAVAAFGVLLAIGALSLALPGDVTTELVLASLLLVGAVVVHVRTGLRRLGGWQALEAAATGVLAMAGASFPYLASGRLGIPGVGVNDDTATHLYWILQVDARGALPPDVASAGYPVGPHAVTALLMRTFGPLGVEAAFVSLLLIGAALMAVTALGVLRDVPRGLRIVIAACVPLTYLSIAYAAQGAYKEPLTSLLVLGACTAALRLRRSARTRGALLAATSAGLYVTVGPTGLLWPAVAVLVLLVRAAIARRRRPRDGRALLSRRNVLVGGVVLGVVAIVAVVMRSTLTVQVKALLDLPTGGGNLSTNLPFLEVFGVWNSPDFRTPPTDLLHSGAYSGIAALLAIAGCAWWLRRGDWSVPVAALVTLGLYAISVPNQGPYWVAKLLAIASPLVMLITLRALFARMHPGSWWTPATLARAVVGVTLVIIAGNSTVQALAASPVTSMQRTGELAKVRDAVGPDDDVLYLGQDFYMNVKMRGLRVSHLLTYSVVNPVAIAPSPTKPVSPGTLIDFDSVDAATLDKFDYVLTARTRFASDPPDNFHSVERTRSYELFKRSGSTRPRTPVEGGNDYAGRSTCAPGAPTGRARIRTAALRLDPTQWFLLQGGRPNVTGSTLTISPGQEMVQTLELPRGQWDFVLQYLSPVPLRVSIGGQSFRMEPETDVMGQRWPIGRVDITRPLTNVSIRAEEPALDIGVKAVLVNEVAAARDDPATTLTGRQTCGKLVDWIEAD